LGDKNLLGSIFAKDSVDVAIDFASNATVPISIKNPSPVLNDIVSNGINLLDVMLDSNCKRLTLSSVAARYGRPKDTPIEAEHNKTPINAYGDSKLTFESILGWYHLGYGLQVNSFRYLCTAGASNIR
jgi:UDP-glucose 4-epimerase